MSPIVVGGALVTTTMSPGETDRVISDANARLTDSYSSAVKRR